MIAATTSIRSEVLTLTRTLKNELKNVDDSVKTTVLRNNEKFKKLWTILHNSDLPKNDRELAESREFKTIFEKPKTTKKPATTN